VKPGFTVLPAWREELFQRLTKKDVGIDRAMWDKASRVIDRDLELRVARLAFGDSAARRHRLTEDTQLSRALELLRSGRSQQDLFAMVAANPRK
jgi:hypothetical protein